MQEGTATVLVFGLGSHPVLGALYQQLVARGRRRVLFVPLESYPSSLDFSLFQGEDGQSGSITIDGEPPVAFADIVSVCLDGYFITAGGEGLSEEDQQYRQAESWAALVALFKSLSRRCLVANHVVERDHFHSRLSELYLLHSHGLRVPRTLVTSNAAQARAFAEQVGAVMYRPVMGRDLPFRQLQPEDFARLDEIRLSPVHFEEAALGAPAGCILVGDNVYVNPRDAHLPDELLEGFRRVARELGLHLAELRLRYVGEGWLVTALHPFLTLEGLQDQEAFLAAAELLETGLT